MKLYQFYPFFGTENKLFTRKYGSPYGPFAKLVGRMNPIYYGNLESSRYTSNSFLFKVCKLILSSIYLK